MRLARDRGAQLRQLKLWTATSYGEQKANVWMLKITAAELRKRALSVDVLWPINTDPWARAALAPLIKDASCRTNPERYFLIPQSHRSLRCVPKNKP